ncbi:MAG TPA: hypothetical protein VF352_04800, partial [Anaerolineales bacterium]
DKHLLTAFLQAYGLPTDANFACNAMVTSILYKFEVYGYLFSWKPELQELSTLDELAERLWNVND